VRLFSFFFFSTFDLLFTQNRGEWSVFNGDQQYCQKQIVQKKKKKNSRTSAIATFAKKSEILFFVQNANFFLILRSISYPKLYC
jgi:hypothetical protein